MPKHPSPHRVKRHQIYTVWEAADAVGVHRQTVIRWIKEKGLPADTSRRPDPWEVPAAARPDILPALPGSEEPGWPDRGFPSEDTDHRHPDRHLPGLRAADACDHPPGRSGPDTHSTGRHNFEGSPEISGTW